MINFKFKHFIVENFWKKMAFMLPAVLLMGVFVSILVEIGWGTDPASFMNLNMSHVIGLSLGPTEVITYGIMFIFVIFFGAHMIGFGTLANMILIGYVVDFCRWVWSNIGFTELIANGGFAVKLPVFIGALLLFVIVAAIYINAQMGVAPYDALPVIIGNALPKVPFFIIRQLFDFAAVGIGVFFGLVFSPDGIQGSCLGSIAMSVALGPVISLVNKPLQKIL